ncbi:MAG: hypothetical protein LBE81_10210 [Azonexus sp.]|uniref:hypothetical protein n=1 Tax=Azonexus sp. TaxID=1872668 RepID=UPI0028312BE4|nr:hypothetical protein [Azonexus sp.]MDR0776992.1 hypothetical protein [Azonexus sp.]
MNGTAGIWNNNPGNPAGSPLSQKIIGAAPPKRPPTKPLKPCPPNDRYCVR